MEELLTALMKDAQAAKFTPVRQSCQKALDVLQDKVQVESLPAYALRERCLEPLQLAFESRVKRLMNHAVAGIEKLLKDERLQATIETENEDKWLPIQVLKSVYSTPNLPEDIQVDVMKLLLKMTLSTSLCMNSHVLTHIAEVYIELHSSSSSNVRGVVQANLTQLLSNYTGKLFSSLPTGEKEEDVLSDFNPKGNNAVENVTDDVVKLLEFLLDKITAAQKAGQNKHAIPLLLEGVYAVLTNSSTELKKNEGFQHLVWKSLCPTLISLLGLPKTDEKPKPSGGHNLDCPTLLPATARTIYSISVHIAKMVGPMRSLRPVLESLFHRILICPAPSQRHDAIKAVKELLTSPSSVCNMTVTVEDDISNGSKSTTQQNDIALVKLVVDSIQECSHSNDSALCYLSVNCIDELLASIEQLDQGVGIHGDKVKVISEKYRVIRQVSRSMSERSSSVTSQSDVEESSSPSAVKENMKQPSPAEENTEPTSNNPHHQQQPADDVPANIPVNYKSVERKSARDYMNVLSELVVQLLAIHSVQEVDEAIQMFSSEHSDRVSSRDYSSANQDTMSYVSPLNADSIYSTTYTVLNLSLRLSTSGFYETGDKSTIPISEKVFIDTVLDTDMFLYLSPDWLSQVYKCVLQTDLLKQAGWIDDEDLALIILLKDMDGQGSHLQGGQMLTDSVFDREDMDDRKNVIRNPENVEAGKLLAKQILSTCWSGILDVLSVMLNGKSVCGVTNTFAIMIGTDGAKEESLKKREALTQCLNGLQKAAKLCCSLGERYRAILALLFKKSNNMHSKTNTFAIKIGTDGAKEESLKKREALTQCLNGLQKAAKLCCSLGLQERCAAVFELLANTSCVIEDFKHATQVPVDRTGQKPGHLAQSKPKLAKLHAAHVLSMDALMTTGLEIGSHSAKCWKHVFRCCAFISELEHTYFSHGNNLSSLPRIQQEYTMDVINTDHDPDDLYSVPMTPVVPVAPRINVTNLIKQSGIESGWDRSISGRGMLNSAQASQALCGLSQEVDKLFEDAANNLNMRSLCDFLGDLCESSKQQLHKISKRQMEDEDNLEYHRLPLNSLHLYRLQSVLMKVAHSNRPLLHLIKAWSVVSAYLVESAGHKDRSVSKLAVTCVHDYIIAVMASHRELTHFHTNEMLCKTFENILCLELCDGDVQDQIVCSICELVETSASDIRSGWRPLFGALRAVRIEYTTIEEVNEARQRHVEAVLDVFDVYLNTDNILVFANATVDCILCLLKYVRGPGEFEDSDTEDDDSVSDYMMSSPASENLCLPALQYLKQCSIILQSMWKMPACPVFHGAKRIQVDTNSRCVDPNIPNMNFTKFARYFQPLDGAGDASQSTNEETDQGHDLDLRDNSGAGDCKSIQSCDSGIIDASHKDSGTTLTDGANLTKVEMTLDDLDTPTGILHVWFLMLEGLSGTLSGCPKSYQSDSMEALFELLRSASHLPGPKFGIYCVNHLLLPMLQSWLRCGSKKYGYWETSATNFKQCCGHATDLIVDLVHDFKDDKEIESLIENVLSKLLIVLTECVAQPFEVISRLGCSCIRHILLSAGNDFTDTMWQTVIDGLQNAINVTTYCLRQIMVLFREHSENFYGDIGQLKVATRKDCSAMEFVRMWHLAQQVFLLDSQVTVEVPNIENQEDKSYVLLLYPPGFENSLNPDHILARAYLVSDTAPVGVPFKSIVVGLLSHQLLLQTIGCILLEGNDSKSSQIPGRLSQLSTKHVKQLMDCLRNSYKIACDFDLRPGLKFLLQKVAHTPVAVNLYKQAGASMVFYIHTLIKICSNIPELSVDKVKTLLKEETKDNDNDKGDCKASKGLTKIKQKTKPQRKNDSHDGLSKTNNETKSNDEDAVLQSDVEMSDLTDKTCNNSNENVKGAKQTDDTNERSSNQHDDYETDEKHKNASNVGQNELKETVKNNVCVQDEMSSKGDMKRITAKNHHTKVLDCPGMYLAQLLSVCEELCQSYIDILYDKGGTSCVDNMADQQLFFLIAQPDELPEIGNNKVDLAKLNKDVEKTRARLQGMVATTQVNIQDEGNIDPPAITRTETESVLPPISPTHVKSKKEMRSEQESRVYNLATDKLIKNLMSEYKKKKNQNAMPTFSKPKKEKKEKKKRKSGDPVEEIIEQQRQTSIMKDSEAHLQSWTELLCSILGLFEQLDDHQFTSLLPVLYGSVNHLVCHAQDMRLRERLAEMLHRIGDLFNIALT